MMEVLELLRTKKITLDDARRVTELVNVYLIRRYLTNLDTSDITRFFPTYLRLVREQAARQGYGRFYELCRDTLIRSTRQKSSFVPDDTDVRNYLRTANAYNLKNMRFILEKVEMRESNVPFVPLTMSIEHIMPQTRGKDWVEARGATNEQYVSYVNRLGNLTLASKTDNSVMGNQSFATKKEILRKSSHIKMNEAVLALQRWDFAAIDRRTEQLIDEILRAFPITVDNYVEQPDEFDNYVDRLEREEAKREAEEENARQPRRQNSRGRQGRRSGKQTAKVEKPVVKPEKPVAKPEKAAGGKPAEKAQKAPKTARVRRGGNRPQRQKPMVEEIKRPENRTRWNVKN